MAIARYQKKISGPLLDRIDIHVEVPRVDYEKLADKRQVEDSKTVRARVQAARERQLKRFKGTKLARTIADLAGSEMIAANHVAETVQYRPRVGM